MTAKNKPMDPKVKKRKAQMKKLWKQTKIFIIFAIAVFAFAIMGLLPNSGGIVSGGVAAMVNGEAISRADFLNLVSRQEQQMGAYLGKMDGPFKQQMLMRIRNDALQSLISRELLKQSAKDVGIYASDDEVRDILMNTDAFKDGDKFSQDRYFSLLKANRIKHSDYEQQLRDQIVIDKFRNLFSTSVTNTDIEAKATSELQNSKVNIGFVKFSKSDIKASATAEEANQFAAENAEEVKKYYDNNKSEFTDEEQIRARHILIKVADKKNTDAAKTKINKAIERLKNEDFADVAKDMSEDPGSAKKGGDLGFFARGRMVKPFEEKAFAMKVGEVSDVVTTDFGFHVIKVEEKKDKQVKSFDEVKTVIATKLVAQKKSESAVKNLKEVAASGDAKAINAALKSAGLKWQETGDFPLNQPSAPKLGDDERLIDAALALKPGSTHKGVVASRGNNYLIKLIKLDIKSADAKAKTADSSWQLVFEEWFKGIRSAANIKPNNKLITGS